MCSFNRTSLELKLCNSATRCSISADAFNRTSLELKPFSFNLVYKLRVSFNRTSLELKLSLPHYIVTVGAFNRTSLELKLLLIYSATLDSVTF